MSVICKQRWFSVCQQEQLCWLCTCCTRELFPFNHYDEDDDYLAALADNWPISIDFANQSNLREKIFVPFDLNDEMPSPLEDKDPDVNYYQELRNMSFNTCDYYYEESFNKKCRDLAISNESFSVIHINARSIPRNLPNIENYMDSLATNFTIIAITETWLKEENKDCYAIQSYCAEHNVWPVKTGGGVALFIKHGIDYHVRNDLTVMNDCVETLFIEIDKEVVNSQNNMIVGVISSTWNWYVHLQWSNEHNLRKNKNRKEILSHDRRLQY